MDEVQHLPPPLSARDLLRILRRRKWIGLSTFAAIVAGTLFFTSRMEPTYEAKTRLLVENRSSSAIPSSLLGLLGGAAPAGGSVELEFEKMRSRTFLKEVIREAKLKNIGPLELEPRISMNALAGGEILVLQGRAKTAKEATDIANAMARVYIDSAEKDADRKVELSTRRMRRAQEKARQEKEAAEKAYKDFARRVGNSNPDQIYSTRAAKQLSVRNALEDAQQSLRVKGAERAKLIAQVNSISPHVMTGHGLNKNTVIDNYEAKLYDLRIERSNLLQDYQEDADEVKLIDNRIAQTEKELERARKEPYSVGSKAVARNPDYSNAITLLHAADRDIATAKKAIAENEKALAKLTEEQRALANQSLQFQDLKRKMESATKSYESLRVGIDDATLNRVVSAPVIQVLDEALVPVAPVSPKPTLNLIMAIALGTFLSLGVMLMAEYLSATKDGDAPAGLPDADRYLPQIAGVPLLGMVPATATPEPAGGGLPLLARGSNAIEDAFREVGYCLAHREPGSPVPVVLLSGLRSDDSTAALAAHLAATLVRDGLRITLVDADRNQPRLNRVFGKPDAPGLADVLAGRVRVQDILHVGADGSLRFLSAGAPSDATPLSEDELRKVFRALGQDADTDLVLVSGPSVWSARLVAPLEKAADGMVLIAPPDAPAQDSVARARRLLANGYQPRLLGVVLSEGNGDGATTDAEHPTAMPAPAAVTGPVGPANGE